MRFHPGRGFRLGEVEDGPRIEPGKPFRMFGGNLASRTRLLYLGVEPEEHALAVNVVGERAKAPRETLLGRCPVALLVPPPRVHDEQFCAQRLGDIDVFLQRRFRASGGIAKARRQIALVAGHRVLGAIGALRSSRGQHAAADVIVHCVNRRVEIAGNTRHVDRR